MIETLLETWRLARGASRFSFASRTETFDQMNGLPPVTGKEV